jgi:uncharacterized membrane protein YeiB
MKHSNYLLVIVKIIAIVIVLGYGIGLFKTYGLLQASAMFVVAIFLGIELIFMAKQATNKD